MVDHLVFGIYKEKSVFIVLYFVRHFSLLFRYFTDNSDETRIPLLTQSDKCKFITLFYSIYVFIQLFCYCFGQKGQQYHHYCELCLTVCKKKTITQYVKKKFFFFKYECRNIINVYANYDFELTFLCFVSLVNDTVK